MNCIASSSTNVQNWFVYIVQCSDNTLYTGITTNLTRRLNEHNGTKKGAKYTRYRQPVKIVYQEEYETRSKASIREAEIKKMSCNTKKTLFMHNIATDQSLI